MTNESQLFPSAVPAASNPTPDLFAAVGLCKQFGGVDAIRDVSLGVNAGEVLAVIGENGAGKSTLMKILAGVLKPDSGRLLWQGREVAFHSVSDAIAQGICLIHQELNLVDNLTVAENLFLGREPQKWGWVNRGRMAELAQDYLSRVGLQVNPNKPLGLLSVAEKQLVEIAKAVSTGARVLVMDEPTSSLSNRETEKLFELVDSLRSAGTAVLYISHRLVEVDRLADRVEVIRDGRNVGALARDEINHNAMVRAMVGRDPKVFAPPVQPEPGPLRLEVKSLRVPGAKATVDLSVRGGEITVIAGLVGAGRSELLETIFGLRRPEGGEIRIDGVPLAAGSVREAIRAGLALVSEDRKLTGLHLHSSVCANLTMAAIGDSPRSPWIDRHWEAEVADELIRTLSIKAGSRSVSAGSLSGGNQQKIAIGKWLIRSPRVFLLDEPTRGVDVGARFEIYQALQRLAGSGVAVLVVSSDMEEVIGIASRVIVMCDHRIAGVLNQGEITEPAIMRLAVGGISEPTANAS